MSSWAREHPELMEAIARMPYEERQPALAAEAAGLLLRFQRVQPCKNSSVPFCCPITYSCSEWSEQLLAYFCRECGVSDE